MHVADKMQNKLQSRDLFFNVGRRIGELRSELLYLVDHAVCFGAVRSRRSGRNWRMVETCFVEVRRGDLDIDEVPLPSSLPRSSYVCVSEFIGPGRGRRYIVSGQGVRIRGK